MPALPMWGFTFKGWMVRRIQQGNYSDCRHGQYWGWVKLSGAVTHSAEFNSTPFINKGLMAVAMPNYTNGFPTRSGSQADAVNINFSGVAESVYEF